MNPSIHSLRLSRRALLGGGSAVAAAGLVGGCASQTNKQSPPAFVAPTSSAVATTEAARRSSGREVSVTLTARTDDIDLAGKSAKTWSFGTIPAQPLRVSAGDTLRATVRNQVPQATSVHWHGIAIRNDMDGVAGLTQTPIATNDSREYRFITEHPGTYWFHPHVGTQLDRGLYGALIVEDPDEPLQYDREWVVVLDDLLDGVTTTPDKVLSELSRGMSDMGMGGMGDMPMRMGNTLMGAKSELLGGDAGDVYYPTYLINGQPPQDPATFRGKPGDRVRIRIINASGDTAYRVALGDHTMTITHTDGYPTVHRTVDSLLIGMGERYDVIVTLKDGVFPFAALAEGKSAGGFAVARSSRGTAPKSTINLPQFNRRIGVASKLTAASTVRLRTAKPDQTVTMRLTGTMEKYDWAINGQRFDSNKPLQGALAVTQGQRIRLNFVNNTKMWHPMHLHGHTYQHPDNGPRKDTSIVLPGQTLSVEFDADNPGRWLSHCHNIYHGESGMMTVVAYRE